MFQDTHTHRILKNHKEAAASGGGGGTARPLPLRSDAHPLLLLLLPPPDQGRGEMWGVAAKKRKLLSLRSLNHNFLRVYCHSLSSYAVSHFDGTASECGIDILWHLKN